MGEKILPRWKYVGLPPVHSRSDGKALALSAGHQLPAGTSSDGASILRRRLLEGEYSERGKLWRELSTKIAWAIGTTCGLSYSGKRSPLQRIAQDFATDLLDNPGKLSL